jgi:hypothetical protein
MNEIHEEDMLVPYVCHCQHMGHLVFCRFRGRGDNMCSLGIDYYRGCLCCGDIELEGDYVGLISI